MSDRAMPIRWEIAMLALITLLAAGLRLYRLPEIPPGLHFDEGFKGVTARALLDGAPPQLFFERDMGEEPLAIYLVAAALAALGLDPWIIRLPSALVGTLTVPLVWWLGRELSRYTNPLAGTGKGGTLTPHRPASLDEQIVALGSALVLAILYWHLSFSRLGLEPILVPFFACLAFAALVRGLNTHRWLPFAAAGLALAGSLYTYKADYLVPIVALLFVAYAAVVERGFLRHHWRGLLVTAAVAVLLAAPITIYFAIHPANFLQRPASVTVEGSGDTAGSPWRAVGENLAPVLAMFFLEGDANPRSNLPGRPALDPFLALVFLTGLVWSLIEFRRAARMLPVIWLGVMVLPTLVTQHAPHFGRAIGATPAVAVLCAVGGWSLWQGAARFGSVWVRRGIALVLAIGLLVSTVSTARAYFQTWGDSPDLFYAYDVGLVQIADFINSRPQDEDVYLTPTSAEHFTLQYLVGRPFSSFDGRDGLVLPPPHVAATFIVLLQEDGETPANLQQIAPNAARIWSLSDDTGRPYAAAYHFPASAGRLGSNLPDLVPEPSGAAGYGGDATFGDAVRLLGYSLDSARKAPGERLKVTLYWQVLEPLDRDYTVFTHLLGEYNPATGGPIWAGHDGQPDGGHYPTSAWRVGQTVIDVHTLDLAPDIPPGTYQLETGLYLLQTLARLPTADSTGAPLPGDAALLGVINIRGASHEP